MQGSQLNMEEAKPFLDAVKKANNVYFPITFNTPLSGFLKAIDDNEKLKQVTDPIAKKSIINHLKQTQVSYNSEKLRDALSIFKLDIENEDLFASFPYRNTLQYLTFSPIYLEILQVAKGIGAINVASDEDGTLREFIPFFSCNNNFYPSLALAVVISLLPEKQRALKFLPNGDLEIGSKILPIDNEGKIMIRWMAPTGSYKHYSMAKVLTSYENNQEGIEPLIPPEAFKDKIVIIGETHAGPNKLTIPLSKAISGTEVQANIIDNLLNRNTFITRLMPLGNFIIALIMSFFVSIVVLRLKSGFSVAATYLALIIGYMVFALFIFLSFNMWIDIVYPLGFMSIVFIVTFLVKYTMLSKAYEDTYQLAIKDGLTNLYNHKYFQETLARDFSKAQRHKENLCLLMIDIDYFKKFNDSYGHRAGDAILRQVAQTLKKSVRTSDLVARYGGEEMAIVLYNANYSDGKFVAQKLVNIINDTVFLVKDNLYKNITVSIGVSNYPEHCDRAAGLIDLADKSLYVAKAGGRNRIGVVEEINQETEE